ncbi:hypothetical protein K438DRAFT_1941538 [Mycena galopus ATCC 62051]|nr:hypothetical protein K438DRAFT_1941538 [Mycena galopus ATCC 62051]
MPRKKPDASGLPDPFLYYVSPGTEWVKELPLQPAPPSSPHSSSRVPAHRREATEDSSRSHSRGREHEEGELKSNDDLEVEESRRNSQGPSESKQPIFKLDAESDVPHNAQNRNLPNIGPLAAPMPSLFKLPLARSIPSQEPFTYTVVPTVPVCRKEDTDCTIASPAESTDPVLERMVRVPRTPVASKKRAHDDKRQLGLNPAKKQRLLQRLALGKPSPKNEDGCKNTV